MRIRFTKKADGRHRLTVVRDDGTVSQGQMVPGLGRDAIPHDLLHALVERALTLRRGVYGLVNTGLGIAELLDPSYKPSTKGEPELMVSEIATTLLQGEAAYGLPPEDFATRLRDQCSQHGVPVPAIDAGVLAALRASRHDYQRRWQALAVGDTVDVDVP